MRRPISWDPPSKRQLREYFDFYVQPEPNTGCHLWLGNVVKYRGGYGAFTCAPAGYTMARAHRVAWELHHDVKLSEEEHVLHSCDNPICVNIDHLFLGDQASNMRDKAMKGRQLQGEFNPAYKHGLYIGDKKNPEYP